MGAIKLDGQTGCSTTLISNKFIDEYMPNANGEFVKIYLYLLRAYGEPGADISVCHIADVFNHTEKDVIRALKYWEQAGLLALKFDKDKILTNISFLPYEYEKNIINNPDVSVNSDVNDNSDTVVNSAVTESIVDTVSDIKPAASDSKAAKKVYTADELDSFKKNSEVVELLYLAQKYIGKTLSSSDTNTLLYFYDVLKFEIDLIEYLIEYCVTNGHKSLRYMEKVAISWADEGIDTAEKAKLNTDTYISTCYPVLKAFGITGRNAGTEEKAFIVKWTNSYGFNMDIIIDACRRTLSATSKPSFKYADSILTKWHEKGIKNINDIKVLDIEHQNSMNTHNRNSNNKNADIKNSDKAKNTFNNFNQRTYNYEALEKELLNNV